MSVDGTTGGDGLAREFGALTLTLTGIGTVIGAGIFVITGQAAALHAGPAIALSFVLAGVVCLFAAFCYAEMAGQVPLSGGAYNFAETAFGRKMAWLVGWAILGEYTFAAGAIAISWSGYVQSVIADFGIVLPAAVARSPWAFDGSSFVATGAVINLPAVLIMLAVTASHLVGLKESARFNNFTVFVKLSAVALFILFGLAYAVPANWTPFIPPAEARPGGGSAFGYGGIAAGAAMVFFAYLGFDALTTASQETRDPQRSVPRALLATLAISTVLYILVALAMTGLADFRTLGTDAPIVTALAAAGGGLGWLKTYVGIAVSIGLWAGLWPCVFAMSRLFWRFSQDGFVSPWLGELSPRLVPARGVVVAGVITTILSAFAPIALLGELISTGTLIAFAVVCAAVIRLRLTQPARERPFKAPLWWLVAPLGVLSCLALLASMGGAASLRAAAWQGIGLGVLALSLSLRRSPR
jgi:APA family basic amino acid/polyamine antiporter